MKVSVIIPVYNSEKYLDRCLNSLVKQSYSDIEVIIIDNGSEDNSVNIIKEYSKNDKRIKLYTCNTSGASSARNLSLNMASGEYALFVDSDDYVSEYYVEKMTSCVKSKKVMVLCNNQEIWKCRIDERQLFENVDYEILSKEEVIKEIASGRAGLVCSKLVDLSIVKENNIQFDTNVKLSEDLLFFLEIAKYTEDFIHINESLYFYDRRNENSITRRYLENAWENQIYVLNKIKQILSQLNIKEEDKELILCNKLKNCISFSIVNELDDINFKNFKYKVKNIKEILNKKINMEKIEKNSYNSFQEKVILSGIKASNKSMWIAQLLFIFKVLLPIKYKISTIR